MEAERGGDRRGNRADVHPPSGRSGRDRNGNRHRLDRRAGVGVHDSTASGVIQAPLKKLTKGKVSISGTAKVGKKLSAKVSKWKPSGIKFRYQWLRNGVAIGGATKSSYKIAKADKGLKISVRVTATKAGYATSRSPPKRPQR